MEQIIIISFRTQATNTSITTNYGNVAYYDLLTYNMESATLAIDINSK